MKAQHSILRELVISTANLTRETADAVRAGTLAGLPQCHDNFDHAVVVVFVSEDDEDEEDLPADLRHVLNIARKLWCQYVRIDRDAPILEDLPAWEGEQRD